MRKKRLPAEAYVNGILSGDKVILSRAITLVESTLPEDGALSEEILNTILPHSGNSQRIGITGVPGVGKSTFIEVLGTSLVERGKHLAVLAVDPSSQRSGGSILGDKTRMEQLSHHPNAYIRPSATGNSLGGVANRTRETMLLCEAAGYDVIFVETVGVGQSEVAVKGMVDFFLLLMLAGAGDELQGIKKGIMEMADTIAITKVDGTNKSESKKAVAAYKNALHLFPPHDHGWQPEVLSCSAMEKTGIDKVWLVIESYYERMSKNNIIEGMRQQQNLNWLHESIQQQLNQYFYNNPLIEDQLHEMEESVKQGKLTPRAASRQLIAQTSIMS